MNTVLPSMREAAAPLVLIALLMGSENEHNRLVGAQAVFDTSVELAVYVAEMEHAKTCARCSARQKMTQWLSDLTSDRDGY
jgi:hypothetical protein